MTTVEHLTEENFETMTADKVCLLDFWATWCGPCQRFAPILDEAASELPADVLVGKIDVDKEQRLAIRYGIRTIPTIMILNKEGQVMKTMMGVQDKATLLKELGSL